MPRSGCGLNGFNNQFEFQQHIILKLKHSPNDPSIMVTLLGFPIEWTQKIDEGSWERSARVNSVLDDRAAVRSKELEVKVRMEDFLQEYQELLKHLFVTKDIKQELKIDFTRIVVYKSSCLIA